MLISIQKNIINTDWISKIVDKDGKTYLYMGENFHNPLVFDLPYDDFVKKLNHTVSIIKFQE